MKFIGRFFRKAFLVSAVLAASFVAPQAQTGVAPRITFLETDQTLPAGLWRINLNGDVMTIDKNTAAANNFTTATTAISIASNGDVTIPNDFFVTGSATVSVNTTVTGNLDVQGNLIIDATNVEALLVRKDGDAGDVFTLNSSTGTLNLVEDASNQIFIDFGGTVVGSTGGGIWINQATPSSANFAIRATGTTQTRINATTNVLFTIGNSEVGRYDASGATWKRKFLVDGTVDEVQVTVQGNATQTSGLVVFEQSDGTDVFTVSNTGTVTVPISTAILSLGTNPASTGTIRLPGEGKLVARNAGNTADIALIGVNDSDEIEISNLLNATDVINYNTLNQRDTVTIGAAKTAAYDAILVESANLSSSGQKDSGAIIVTGKSFDVDANDSDWKQFVDVTSNAGASTFTIQSRIDAASFVNRLTVTDGGVLVVTSVEPTSAVAVGFGGTGATTLTDGGILLGSGTGAITALAQATNGQIPIGSTGADPVLASITGTANQITNTEGAGTITLSVPSAFIAPGSVVVTTTLGVTGTTTLDGVGIIDITDAEAFLVRQNADGGDVFTVNTTSSLVTVTGDITVTNDLNMSAGVAYGTEFDDGTAGAADTIDWNNGNKHLSTLDENVTYTFTAPPGPANLILRIVQDVTGTNTVTWPAAVFWEGGVAPTITATGDAVDIASFYYDGTNYHGSVLQDMQ